MKMPSNLDRFKKDLAALIDLGDKLHIALQCECNPEGFKAAVQKEFKDAEKIKTLISKLPKFNDKYQTWYSEAKALVTQLLPERIADFVRLYEKPKTRKAITYESYTIEDCLQGLTVTQVWGKEKVVGPDAAIPLIQQQVNILKSASQRFESSLFDIRQLVQADLFDSELDAATELSKHKFARAAGAVAGVVLEKHLAQVCGNHSVAITKTAPHISDLNDALKAANVIDVPQWRFIQHLGDLRNLCDHNKKAKPTEEQVNDLIAGVAKTIKTLF